MARVYLLARVCVFVPRAIQGPPFDELLDKEAFLSLCKWIMLSNAH